jgi:dihydropyrimidinase
MDLKTQEQCRFSMKQLLSGGQIWQESGFAALDIQVENGTILQLGENLLAPYAEVIDCRDAFILPGICDLHVHVGEKVCGLDLADDWASLAKLADKSGIAAIGAFITERSAADSNQKTLLKQYEETRRLAEQDFQHPVRWHLTPTLFEPQDILPLLQENCDLKFYTTYKPNGLFRSYEEIGRWMQDLSDLRPRILIHCEDDAIVTTQSALHPFRHPFDCTKRRPEQAEVMAVEQVLELAVKHNYPLHIVHVSTPQAALLINEARNCAPVTCETAPQYLLLNESYLQREDGHRWLCTPPLRAESTRGLLLELLQEGLFDAIATDHCPYTTTDKDEHKGTPELVPVGLAGLGATFPLLHENLVRTGKIPLAKLLPLLTTHPAKLMNVYPRLGCISPGSLAEFIILKQEPAKSPQPVIPSLSDTPNPWQDFSHQADFSFFRGNHETTA